VEPLTRHNSNEWLPALPINIRVGWECLIFSNTLAYYDAAKITAVRCSTPSGLRKTKKERKIQERDRKRENKNMRGNTT
jgi:hypothetical protein